MIGRTLSHFRILAKIGEGGMGVVYRAEDTKLRRQVALKVLPPELVSNEERRLRFLREARAAAAVTHPNIATIHEVDEADGVVFIAMELVEGKTLREHIGGRPMPIKDALRIATEMAEGLAKAHQAKVIHRDLKPDNVIVDSDGHAKILDFGLAKLLEERAEAPDDAASKIDTISREMTREGKIFGTAAYMSPEQARGQKVDARSDIFSFGTTLYEMVTGKVPFEGKTNTDILSAIIRDTPPSPAQQNADVPPKLEEIIQQCLEKDPQDRYLHTDQLAADLRKAKRVTDSGVQVVRTPSGPVAVARSSDWTRLVCTGTRRTALVAALAVLLIAGGVATWWVIQRAAGFKLGDRIIVTDFENDSGNPIFDTTVRDVVELMIAESSYLKLKPRASLKDSLIRLAGSESAKVDRDVASRICRDGSCAGFVAGRIDSDEEGYRVEIALYRTGEDRPAIQMSRVASDVDHMLLTIHELLLDARRAVGESSQTITQTYPPTTTSLAAVQAYAVGTFGASDEEGMLMFREALKIDGDFVDAYLRLSDALWNLGEYRESRWAAEQAYERSAQLPKQAQMMNEIYYLELSYQFDTELERLKTYRRLYPFSVQGAVFLSLLYDSVAYDDQVSAEEHYRDAYRLWSSPVTFDNLAGNLAKRGKEDEIEQLVEDYRRRGGNEYSAARTTLYTEAIRGGPKAVLETVDRLVREIEFEAADAGWWLMKAHLVRGSLAEAEKAASVAWQAYQKGGNTGGMFRVGLIELWLRSRRTDGPVIVSAEQLKPALGSMLYLPSMARFCLETQFAEPLERVILKHERTEGDSTSRFVREELQYARGILLLLRREARQAFQLLEPLARKSSIRRRHWALARTYEALAKWPEAAHEYEEYLEDYLNYPFQKWLEPRSILDQHRLARIYERLGETDRARHWYERFLDDWKDADPDIPELVEARKRRAALGGVEAAGVR